MSLPHMEVMSSSFQWAGIAGACVRGGNGLGRSDRSSGDCILLNFKKKFFGISDSSDRDPFASRQCLTLLDSALALPVFLTPSQRQNSDLLNRVTRAVTARTEAVLRQMKGQGPCTLTGIQLLEGVGGTLAVLMHTGDSVLYEYDPATGEIALRTENNFWMVGKTVRCYQISLLELKPGAVVLMATDGVSPLHGASTSLVKDRYRDILHRHGVEDIPEKILAREVTETGMADDAAVIAVVPHRLAASNRKILLVQKN